jgi:NitT/TauT family transport system substrate-binding protein
MKRCSVLTCLLWLSLPVVAATAEPIRISVGSDPAFTAFYYASQQKLFEKAGLDVRLSIVTQAGDAMDGLVAGQYDFVAGSESTTMVRAERASLKALGVFWQSASYIKLTVDSGINSPTDIKTIGFVPGSASELSTLKLFTKYGIDPKSVKQLASPPPELPALLLRKDIDAFFLWEPWPSRAVKQGAKVLLTSGDVGYTSTMLAVTSADWLKGNRSSAMQLMKVVGEACAAITSDPAKGGQAIQSAIKIPAADAVEFLKGTECKARDFNSNDIAMFKDVMDFLASKGAIKTKTDVTNMLEMGFLKEQP